VVAAATTVAGTTRVLAQFPNRAACSGFTGMLRTVQLLKQRPRDWAALSNHVQASAVNPLAYARLLQASHEAADAEVGAFNGGGQGGERGRLSIGDA
jgi:hypothetical protein